MRKEKSIFQQKDDVLPPGLKIPEGYWHQQMAMAFERAVECYFEGDYDGMKEWLELAYSYEKK